jgi:predicted Zn-dependent protease
MRSRLPLIPFLVLLLAGCAARPAPSPTAALLRAEAWLAAGETAAAVDDYLRAAQGSDDPELLGRAAAVAAAAGRGAEARSLVDRWVERAPDDPRARARRATLAFEARELELAVADLAVVQARAGALASGGLLIDAAPAARAQRVLASHAERFPEEPLLQYALASTAWRASDLATAARACATALALDPDWDDATLLAARIAVRRGEGGEALAALAARAAADGSSQALRLAYQMLRAEDGDAAGARRALADEVARDPDGVLPRLSLAAVVAQLGELGAASEALRPISDLAQRDDVRLELGRLAERRDAHAEALLWYREVAGEAHAPAAVAGIARLLAADQGLGAGRDFIARTRAEQPGWSAMLARVEAQLLRDHGEARAARRVLDAALADAPHDADLRYARALAAVDAGALRAALADLRALLAATPDDPALQNALGYTLTDAGRDLDEAQVLLDAALAASPDEPAVLDSVGWLRYRRGDPGSARLYLERAHQLDDDAEIAAHLGEVLWALGERATARAVWEAARVREPRHRVLAATIERFAR